MQKIGEILKSAREKKGLSLHEVGMNLKISPKVLKAIEDNDQNNLPAKTFLRGFIRSYAQYLRLDVDQILKQFQLEVGSTRPDEGLRRETTAPVTDEPQPVASVEEAPPPSPKSTKPEKKPFKTSDEINIRKAYKFLGSMVLVLVIIFVAKMVDKYQKESKRVPVEAARPIVAEETPAPAESLDPTPGPVASTGNLMTPISTPAPSHTPTAATAKATPSLPPIIPVPSPAPAKVVTATPTPVATPAPAIPTPVTAPSPSPTPNTEKPVEVIVESLNSVTIQYSFDGNKFESLSLAPDEFHTFKSKGVLTLDFSDGGAVNLIVNGRDRGVPGTIGKPMKLSFPK